MNKGNGSGVKIEEVWARGRRGSVACLEIVHNSGIGIVVSGDQERLTKEQFVRAIERHVDGSIESVRSDEYNEMWIAHVQPRMDSLAEMLTNFGEVIRDNDTAVGRMIAVEVMDDDLDYVTQVIIGELYKIFDVVTDPGYSEIKEGDAYTMICGYNDGQDDVMVSTQKSW